MTILNNFITIKNIISKLSTNTKIIVVTKTFNMDLINPIINCGHLDFGENRVQEAKEKWPTVISNIPNINLHLIGNLQSNKVKDAVMLFNYIHTLSSEKLAKILKTEQEKINKTIKYFIQVNLAGENHKNGIEVNYANEFIKFCINDLSLQIIGLMCVPPVNENSDHYFSKLKKISNDNKLYELSMGMSGDYSSAIKFGSTYVRIGSKIFGTRQ
jgi:pyridoxal phosphate enzyme (YggS family)